MLKVIIKEAGKQETLSIIDPHSRVDFVRDFIGNYGALSDGQFTYNEETDAHHCDQDTYDWWAKVISDHQALEDRIASLKDEHGSDAVIEAIGNAGDCDLEDQATAINAALDEAFGAPVK